MSVKPVESAIRDSLAPLLLGEDPSRIEYLWNKMFKYTYRYGTEGVILCGLSGIDLALWDLKGKQLGVPVANLLGGLVRDCIKGLCEPSTSSSGKDFDRPNRESSRCRICWSKTP